MKVTRISILLTAEIIACLIMLSTTVVQAAAFYVSEFGTPGSLGTAGVANTRWLRAKRNWKKGRI